MVDVAACVRLTRARLADCADSISNLGGMRNDGAKKEWQYSPEGRLACQTPEKSGSARARGYSKDSCHFEKRDREQSDRDMA